MKKIPAIAGFVLLVVGLGVGLYLLNQQQDVRSDAAPATTIRFTPSKSPVNVGDEFTVDIIANTAENQLTAIVLDVTFDNTKLEVLGVINGSFLSLLVSAPTFNQNAGSISATYGAAPASPAKGTGNIATIKFKAISSGLGSISFGPQTTGTGLGENVGNERIDVISLKQSLSLQINGSTGSSQALPSPGTVVSGVPGGAPASSSPKPSSSPSSFQLGAGGTGSIASSSAKVKPTVKIPLTNTVNPGDTITGTSVPNEAITITIQSEPVEMTAKADSAGNWSVKIPTTLASGTHTITVTDTNGTYSTTFKVASVSSSSLPVSGMGIYTIGFIIMAVLFIGFGIISFAKLSN